MISGNESTHAQLNFKVAFHLVDKGRGSLLLKLWVLLVLQGDVEVELPAEEAAI